MLKIKANPTFKGKVGIPVPGGDVVDVVFEFKHFAKDALDEYINGPKSKDRNDVDTIAGIVVGWEGVDAEFSKDNLAELLKQYHAAPRAIIEGFLLELTQARLKN